MMQTLSTATVCLIACHGGPADHFASYAEKLIEKGCDVQIYAAKEVDLKKFEERKITVQHPFSLISLSFDQETLLAEKFAKECSTAKIVITDIGHTFDVKMHQALMNYPVVHYAFYDNPEPFVPGGYSSIAKEVCQVADGVLFANTNLASGQIYSAPQKEIDLSDKKQIGIGYFNLKGAEKIAQLRKANYASARAKFLESNGIEDTGQKIVVYFGGNNEVYFLEAFPAFLKFLVNIPKKNILFVLHQHPRAKEKNLDVCQLENLGNTIPKVIISNLNSDDIQIFADAALYYQTSMGWQFVMEGIPTIQVGHDTYDDILVRNGLISSVTNNDQFAAMMDSLGKEHKMPDQSMILKSLGIQENWEDNLYSLVK